jgi:REP element-mobilizing transposase RayT
MPFIPAEIENSIHQYLSEQLLEQGCPVRIINGIPDHLHCVFLLNQKKSIATVIKHIKGSSSHYINQNNLTVEKFSWQTGYAAYSVSASNVEKVYHYIKKQKEHHRKKTFNQEYGMYIKY